MKPNLTIFCTLIIGFFSSILPAQNVLDNLKLTEKVDIYFESAKHSLTEDAYKQLQQVVSKYRTDKTIKIRITAHTDGQGTPQSNYILSDKRANAVKYYFLSQNIPPDVLVASTFGQEKPIADNDTESGRQTNRRATIELYIPAPEQIKIVEKEVVVEKPVIQTQTVEKIVTVPVKSEPDAPIVIEEGKPYLMGMVQNSETKSGVKSIVFIRHSDGRVDSMMTEDNGTFKLLCNADEPVTIDVFAKGYFYGSSDVIATRNVAHKIDIQPLNVGSVAAITQLYFEGDAATLLKSSDFELAKILRFMQINNGISIEIAGHVNAPGINPKKLPKDEFNLSTNRANTIRNFLIDNGFSADNIKAKGYGNSQMRFPEPINERQEELNRRVEIKILSL